MQVLVVHFADIGGQGLQSGFAGGPPAAFATDNQVASVVGAFDRDGLDYAQRADRVGQLFERLFIELRARLRKAARESAMACGWNETWKRYATLCRRNGLDLPAGRQGPLLHDCGREA